MEMPSFLLVHGWVLLVVVLMVVVLMVTLMVTLMALVVTMLHLHGVSMLHLAILQNRNSNRQGDLPTTGTTTTCRIH